MTDQVNDKNTILLVEDDQTILMGLSYALRQEGYDVLSCPDAASARRCLKEDAFDLALLDVSLPDGNGYDLCREIRQETDCPVVFLTAHDEEVSVVMGLDMGADDYIAKPFRVRELLSRLRSVLRRSTSRDHRDETWELGDLRIHAAQAKVMRNGTEIYLSALEYRLLLALAAHPGRVLSRTRLLEEIWDIGGDYVNDNTLTVYIKRLRDKIEKDPQHPELIQTVRGLGYRVGGG